MTPTSQNYLHSLTKRWRWSSFGNLMWDYMLLAFAVMALGLHLTSAFCFFVLFKEKRFSTSASTPTPEPSPKLPPLSIVIPARNEAHTLAQALKSVLSLQYTPIQVIVVNDRSTDNTPDELQKIQSQFPQLQVIHVTKLAPNWLGKNHALHAGLQVATGDWVLFTDADVHFASDTLQLAVTHAELHKLDQLVLIPRVWTQHPLLDAVITCFLATVVMFYRPWSLQNPRSSSYFGIGAFNLFRRRCLHDVGGLQAISMRVDDDMALGYLMRKNGYRSDYVIGADRVSVHWYEHFWQFVTGLEKNIYCGMDYRPHVFILGMLAHVTLFWLPWILLLSSHTEVACLAVATIGVMLTTSARIVIKNRNHWTRILLSPVATWVITFIIARSVWFTWKRGGIVWRDTFYPLSELKKQRLRA